MSNLIKAPRRLGRKLFINYESFIFLFFLGSNFLNSILLLRISFCAGETIYLFRGDSRRLKTKTCLLSGWNIENRNVSIKSAGRKINKTNFLAGHPWDDQNILRLEADEINSAHLAKPDKLLADEALAAKFISWCLHKANFLSNFLSEDFRSQPDSKVDSPSHKRIYLNSREHKA